MLKLAASFAEVAEQAAACAKQDRHQVKLDLIEKAGARRGA